MTTEQIKAAIKEYYENDRPFIRRREQQFDYRRPRRELDPRIKINPPKQKSRP